MSLVVRWIAVACITLALPACGARRGDGDGGACPVGWVEAERGGCGPAIVLCAADGEGAARACATTDLRTGVPIPDRDGATSFYLRPDGAIGGGWIEPGGPGAPSAVRVSPDAGIPADDWVPRAGIASCPPDWSRGTNGACLPPDRADCPVGTSSLPIAGRCTSTGVDRCPMGAFPPRPASPGSARVVYVRAGADPTSADGTESRPFSTIMAGVVAAGIDGWILVAGGVYREGVVLAHSAHLIGACAERVQIVRDGVGGTLEIEGATTRVEVRGVRVGGTGNGVLVTRGANATFAESSIDRAVGAGVVATEVGTSVAIDDSFIHDIGANTVGQGRGVSIFRGAQARLTRVAIVASREAGVVADGPGTRVEVTDSLVRSTAPRPTDGILGAALVAARGGSMTARRVFLDANTEVAVQVEAGNAAMEITDALVRCTRPRVGGLLGRGLSVTGPGTLRARRVALVDNREAAASAQFANATLELTESLVADTSPDAMQDFGYGLLAFNGGHVTATATAIVRNTSAGVDADGAGSNVVIRDSVVGDTRTGNSARGFGVFAHGGASVVLERVRLQDNTYAGAVVMDEGSSLAARECVVAGTRMDPPARRGGGFLCLRGATLAAERIRASGNVGAGVAANDPGSTLTLSDSVVGWTTSQPSEAYGIGVASALGATVTVERTEIVETEEVGAFANGEGSTLVLRDLSVRDVRRRTWDDGPYRIVSGGVGIASSDGARVEVFGAHVTDTAAAAVLSYGAGARLHCDNLHVLAPSTPARGGSGVLAQTGGSLECTRAVLEATRAFAVASLGVGCSVRIVDSVIRDVRVDDRGAFGGGLEAGRGARLEAERVLIERSRERGIVAIGAESTVRLTDTVLRGVDASTRGMGFGVVAMGGAQVQFERLSVLGSSGAGLAAIPVEDPVFGSVGGSRISGRDVFIAQTRTSTVRVENGATTSTPTGLAVAYGMHVGLDSTLQARGAMITGGGYGFFAARGAIDIEHAFIRGQLDAAGAADSSRDATTMRLVDMHYESNTINDVVRTDSLPAASALPPPTAVCTRAPCD